MAQVALAFRDFGPGTTREVLKAAGLAGTVTRHERERVSDLADLGVLKPYPARKCRVTSNRATVWAFERCEPRKKRDFEWAYFAQHVDRLIALVRGLIDVDKSQGIATLIAETERMTRWVLDEHARNNA